MEFLPNYLISTFLVYAVLLALVLRLVGVREQLLQRSLILASVLFAAEWLAGTLTGEIESGWVIGTAISVAVFYFFAKSRLSVPGWQLVAIPIGVSIVGNVVVAAALMSYFGQGR